MNNQEKFIRKHATERLDQSKYSKLRTSQKDDLVDGCVREWMHNGNIETAIRKMEDQARLEK